jgi:hypothetical protein
MKLEETSIAWTFRFSCAEPSLNPQLLKDEEIQPSELPFDFENDLFEDYGNTSNAMYQKRPTRPPPKT